MRYWIASAALLALFPWDHRPETVATESGEIAVESLADLDNPFGMAFLSDGRLLITEKPGHLRSYDAAKNELSDPIEGVPEVEFRGQGGLLDVAVAPVASSAGKQQIFLSYSERAEPQPSATSNLGDPRLGQGFDEDDDVLKGLAVARGWLDGDQLVGAKVRAATRSTSSSRDRTTAGRWSARETTTLARRLRAPRRGPTWPRPSSHGTRRSPPPG
jgi:hypothetical protein